MQRSHGKEKPSTLGQTLEKLLETDSEYGMSVKEISSTVGKKGFGLILIVLSLPSAIPVPAPGYSTPFGIIIGLVALQMICNSRTIWLPNKLSEIRIRPKIARAMLTTVSKCLLSIERFIRPRQKWIRNRAGQTALALLIGIMACLMILPIPFTNTLPAIVIFIIGIGLSEEDGLIAIAAFLAGCVAVVLYAGIIYLLMTQGIEAIESLNSIINYIQNSYS